MSPRRTERGFSLVELLVAVFITLIVSGAIYGLIASSQTAFRREPEAADRQQNIRIAMDMITRDVQVAGQGMPWFAQVFTITDFPGTGECAASLNGCGPAGSGILGPAAAVARGGDAEEPDVLEVLSMEEQCPLYTVCDPGAGIDLSTANPLSVQDPFDGTAGCMAAFGPLGPPSLLIVTNNFNFAVVAALAPGAPAAACPASGSVATSGAPLGAWASVPAPGPPQPLTWTGGTPAWVSPARISRYKIFPDPGDGAPTLWRSTSGVFDPATGLPVGGPGAGIGTWQVVARGIEDLQVEYMDGGGAWANTPTAVSCPGQVTPPQGCSPANLNTITRQVRVTLSSRSMAANLQGATLPGTGDQNLIALRGQLQAVIAPRTAKIALQGRPLPEGIP